MAAHVHEDATAGFVDIPEPVGVRAGMLLALLHQIHFAERTLIRHLFRLEIFRRKEQLFGVRQHDALLLADLDHVVGLFERHG